MFLLSGCFKLLFLFVFMKFHIGESRYGYFFMFLSLIQPFQSENPYIQSQELSH